jgi:hypothetical protein
MNKSSGIVALVVAAFYWLQAVYIVDIDQGADRKKQLMEAYRQVFPDLPDARFSFTGAAAWVEERVRAHCA